MNQDLSLKASKQQLPQGDSSPHKSFIFQARYVFRKYFRWWHAGAFCGASVIAIWLWGIPTYLWCLMIASLLLSGAAFVAWLASSQKRAAITITVLFLSLGKDPLRDRLMRWLMYESAPIIAPANVSTPSIRTQPQHHFQQTFTYWKSAVADLHMVRFERPTGDEPVDQYLRRRFDELDRLVSRAKFIPTAQVDHDVVTMCRRHLEIDDLVLTWKKRFEQFARREQLPADTEPIGERRTATQQLLAALFTDPSLLEKLPSAERKTIVQEMLELEQLRLDVHREIEIMQAVLQERYPENKFPLPNIGG